MTGYYVQDLSGFEVLPARPPAACSTRATGTGLSGSFKANTARTLMIEGHVGVPTAAVAVTGNLTVVGQTYGRLRLDDPGDDEHADDIDDQLPGRGRRARMA